MKSARKSGAGRVYEPVAVHPVFGPITPRTFQQIYAALPSREERYVNRRTLASIHRGQPVPEVIQSTRRLPRNIAVPRAGGSFTHTRVGGALVDTRTGEILSAKKVAERDALDPCTQRHKAAEQRRASIISSGYGGKNGARDYKQHEGC